MSDTTDSSSGFPTLSDIGDALSDITTADGESAIHPPTLSGIAKELLLVEAHYATEEAGLRKQIEELESTVRRQAELMAVQDMEIKCSNSCIATLLSQRDSLQSKGERQSPYQNKKNRVRLPLNSLSHEVSPLSHTPGTGSHACKGQSNEASRQTASEALSQSDELSHTKIPSTVPGPPISHFKRLPLDLQRKIWRLTFPEPRFLEVRWTGSNFKVCVAKVPVAMHICQDARREARSEYHQFSSWGYGGQVDLKRDTIYITWVTDTEHISVKQLLSKLYILFSFGGIRHLAIHGLLWFHLGYFYEDKLFELLNSMKELQELTIISFDKVPENTRVERRQGIEFSGVTSMDSTFYHFLKHPRWQPLISKIRYGSVKRGSVSTEPSDNPLKSSSTPTNLEDFSTKPISTLEAAIANPSVSPASTPVRIDVFSDKRARPPAKSVSTLEAATHHSVKPVVSTPTTNADTPAILLPTPETTLTTPDKPVPPPTLKPHCESKFSFGKPTLIPVSPSKFARGLKPHHTHTRSKSAELRASPAMSPFPSQIPFQEPEGWKPEDWKKYLRFGPPTAENIF